MSYNSSAGSIIDHAKDLNDKLVLISNIIDRYVDETQDADTTILAICIVLGQKDKYSSKLAKAHGH